MAVIEEGESEDEKMSSGSENIRKQAQRILDTYNMRLIKVGRSQFQIRLNMFFNFVQAPSIEAEAYDVLQSVEGSVMNYSDSSSYMEKVYDRTSSRISQLSAL